jgi:pimeloyl-ACP methyl ester carboxylesterase
MNNSKKAVILILTNLFVFFISAGKFPDLMKSRWLVIGPFENPVVDGVCRGFDRDYFSDSGGETNLRPVSGQSSGKLVWQYSQNEADRINFLSIYGQRTNCLAYAYNEFKIDERTKAVLKFGSDDGIKIWLNGTLITDHHIHREFVPDEESVQVYLKSGVNRILVKVDQGTGDWTFGMNLLSADEEKAGFLKNKIRGLKTEIFEKEVKDGVVKGCISTVPSFGIDERAVISLCDINDNKISEKFSLIGADFNFDVKDLKPGIYSVRASGIGNIAGYRSEPGLFAVGDMKSVIGRYGKMAADISRMKGYPEADFDIRSTCLFLNDEFEGKMHPSLITVERNLRAAYTVNQIGNFIKNPGMRITGLQQRAYLSDIDGSCQPYSVYVPSSYDKRKKYSLLICLHGFDGNEYDAANNVAEADPQDFIIAGTFGRGDVGYFGIGERDVLDVMNIMKKNFNIDNDSVYITGWSMGGFGTWRFGQLLTDNFAAMASFCGWTGEDCLDSMVNLPVLIVHGTEDTVVPMMLDESAAKDLHLMGYDVRFDIVEGAGHSVWQSWLKSAFPGRKDSPEKLLDYFRKYRRNPYPMSVDIHTKYLRYGKQYWVRLLEFTNPGYPGMLKAKISDDRHISIKAENISVFRMDLSHPGLAKNGRIVLNINGTNLLSDAGKHGLTVGFSTSRNKYGILKDDGSGAVSHDGGGMMDLFSRNLFIIYGTKKSGPEKKWRKFAETISDIRKNENISSGTKVGKYRFMSDKDFIRLSDKDDNLRKADLLLLGSPDENSVVERLGHGLPLTFEGDSVSIDGGKYGNAGVMLCCPNPVNRSRLVGVITMPYNEARVMEFATLLNMKMRLYNSSNDINGTVFPDIMIFKSANEVVASGYFNYNWKTVKIVK